MLKQQIIACLLFLFVFQSHIQAANQPTQKLRFQTQPLLAYNKYAHTFYAFVDSSFYWEYSLPTQSWLKRTLTAPIDIPFDQLLNEFAAIGVNKNELLFVHKSCGSVYSFQRGRIKRIDNSFIHKNQFGAAIYEAKGTVYFFGGYGFFETKNTHAFYLRSANEWFAVAESVTNKPSPRANVLFVQNNDQLYFIGGEVNKTEGTYYMSDCWNYNISTNSWKMLGYLNPILQKRLNRATISNYYSSKLVIATNELIELKPATNQFKVYANPFYSAVKQLLVDKNDEQVLVMSKSSDGNQYLVSIHSYHQITSNQQLSGDLYEKQSLLTHVNFKYLFYTLLLITIFLVLLLLYRPTFISNKLHKSTTVYEDQFYPIEWKVLLYLYNNPQVELSTLNQFFEEKDLNYETLKKRRESLLNGLRKKLAYFTQLKYVEIFTESKHPSDKRVKCIGLNKKIKILDNQ